MVVVGMVVVRGEHRDRHRRQHLLCGCRNCRSCDGMQRSRLVIALRELVRAHVHDLLHVMVAVVVPHVDADVVVDRQAVVLVLHNAAALVARAAADDRRCSMSTQLRDHTHTESQGAV